MSRVLAISYNENMQETSPRTITTQVTPFGDAIGIVLPPEALQKLNVVSGDQLCLVETKDGIELKAIDSELAEQLLAADEVMREDDEALRRLAE
jgi:putative addiction module antidote